MSINFSTVNPSSGSVPMYQPKTLSMANGRKNNGVCIKEYTDLFHEKKIEVIYNQSSGLHALIHTLDRLGNILRTSVPLELTGYSKEIKALKGIPQLRVFFAHTHLIPEKDGSGNINRVSVHLSANGGVKGKIPFQPGLALGSVVRGDTLVAMEKYAELTADEEALVEQMKVLEQRIGELATKIEAPTRSITSTALKTYWTAEKAALEIRLNELVTKLSQRQQKSLPNFQNFQQAVETPIDTAKSRLEVQPRSFDSLNFSSQYISMREDNSEVHDKIEQASSAASVTVNTGGWWFLPSANGSHSWSKSVSDRLYKIKTSNVAQGVLVVNAMVTTRHVRCFTNLTYDIDKVRNILDAMKSNNKEALNRYGITVRKDENQNDVKEIYLLTEAVLGGSFTALITFLDEQSTDRDLHKHAEEKSNASTVGASFGGWFSKTSASISHNSQSGKQTEDDVLRGITSTRVNIEIMSQGALPTFSRNIIEHEITKHLDLNPSKFELSKKDEDDAKILSSGSAQEKYEAMCRRQLKMENAQVAVMNTYRGLTSEKDKQEIHTPSSVMGAYESFSKNMTTDQDCGVPVGFNYTILSEDRLKEILKKLEDSEASSSQSSSISNGGQKTGETNPVKKSPDSDEKEKDKDKDKEKNIKNNIRN